MVACMTMRAPVVVNQVPRTLARRGIPWGELARRTLLPGAIIARLRAPDANPRLVVAERVAAALGVPIETLWTLAARRRGR
jgi:hypothetical protein